MVTVTIFLIWIINLGISIWNAYAVGMAWVETKHAGGWPRFMAWMGAIMSASGFSWCYLIILAIAAEGLGKITPDDVALALRIGYLLLIPGILFSGLMIMLDSWARTYRNRTIANFGISAWNTYAQIHNTFHAIKDIDSAFGKVMESLGDRSDGKRSSGQLVIIFVIVIFALLSGFITTAVIINRVAGMQRLKNQPEDEPLLEK